MTAYQMSRIFGVTVTRRETLWVAIKGDDVLASAVSLPILQKRLDRLFS